MTNKNSLAEGANSLQKKWGIAIRPGFVAIPTVLLIRQRELGLAEGPMIVLQHLLLAWWDAADQPFPSAGTIARRMGVSTRTVQRHIYEIEDAGLIKRVGDGLRTRVRYDMSGTVSKLGALASTMAERREIIEAQASTEKPAASVKPVREENIPF